MTHDEQCSAFDSMIQLLADEGFEGQAEAIAILVNEAMKIERAEALNAEPYERTPARRGYANGFKPRSFNSLASCRFKCRRLAAWISTRQLWSEVSAANELSSWPSPRCTSRAYRPVKWLRSRKSCGAWMSAAAR
jgi:hypothetical protein